MSATTITAILDSNNATSSNSELLDRVSSAFAQFDTACQNVEKSISSLSHATASTSTSTSTYQQDRQGSLQALNHLDVISQWLDIPQTIHQCITNEHWDDALALWDRCRYWQQSQSSTTVQEDQINRVMLIRQIYEQVDHTVQTELAQQLIIHLASDTSLPDLARFLGRLRRVWSDTTMSITDSIARPISLSERLAALLIKARLRWWYQASNGSMIDDSMITTSKLDASSLTTEQHLTALSQYLDIVRTTLPDIHRQWQVLLASSSSRSSISESKEGNKKKQKKQKKKQEKEKKADEDDKDDKDDQMIMTNAAANYLTKQLVNRIQCCLDTIHDITSLVKLESILTHSASSLGRYGSDPLPWMLPNLHEKCLHITRVRIQRINDDCRKEMEQNVDWITAITTSQRAIDTLALPNEPIPVDAMNWPPTTLLQIPIWAGLFNMYMALFNDLRWYAPINIGLPVAESMRDMLQQTATSMSTILHRYCKESASSTNDNDEEDKRQHHHYASTITRYYIYLLVPMLWHALLHQVFGRSTTSHDDNTIVSIDNIESVSIQELKDILQEWINS